MALLKYEEQLKELEKYPHLKKAVEHYYETGGQPEHEHCLPNLIVWIRHNIEDECCDLEPAEFFGMDEETKEDFWSWGHNSRWSNTFWSYLDKHFNYCVEQCMELACVMEDFDVEKYMNETTEV